MGKQYIETKFGKMRQWGNTGMWFLVCPGCGEESRLDDDMLNGRVSVDHTSENCTYHETHDFLSAVKEASAGIGEKNAV